MIIYGEQEFTFNVRKAGCKTLKIIIGKIEMIEADAVIRRVKVEKSLCAVVAFDYLFKWKTFDLDGLQPFISGSDDLKGALWSETGALSDMGSKALSCHHAAEGGFLEEEITGCTLDIREALRWGIFK